MELNAAGIIVAGEWKKTPEMRDRVELGEWVVMPNHVHGIIYLKPNQRRDASNASKEDTQKTKDGRHPSLQKNGSQQNYKNEFGPQRNNISSIIRGFKSSCTRKIREQLNNSFAWQKGFHDHIIRNQKSLLNIERYIRENPYRWNDDKYHN